MPVQACVAQAYEDFRRNDDFLLNTVKNLCPEEWLKRPTESGNHIAWIVGHVTWARKRLLERLDTEWSAPWLGMFVRGMKLDSNAEYPAPDVMIAAWKEVGGVLSSSLQNAPHEVLAKDAAPPSPPTADGKISGVIRFLAWHETYHVGQISLVSCLLGHKGLIG